MREDIIAGLKNALERGSTLEKAVESFINAGYSPAEVKEAAQSLSFGALSITKPSIQQLRLQQPTQQFSQQPQLQQKPAPQQIQPQPLQPYTIQVREPQKTRRTGFIITLTIILLLLLAALIFVLVKGKDFIPSILNSFK